MPRLAAAPDTTVRLRPPSQAAERVTTDRCSYAPAWPPWRQSRLASGCDRRSSGVTRHGYRTSPLGGVVGRAEGTAGAHRFLATFQKELIRRCSWSEKAGLR